MVAQLVLWGQVEFLSMSYIVLVYMDKLTGRITRPPQTVYERNPLPADLIAPAGVEVRSVGREGDGESNV